MSTKFTLVTAAALSAALIGALAPDASASNGTPGPVTATTTQNVTADALPTAQMNGVGWTQVIVGNTVYVGGQFTSARPAGAAAGTGETPRDNLLAYNLTTGALVDSFAVPTNGAVRTMVASADGSRLYIGGDFTTVGGVTHNHLAAITLSSGAVDSGFAPDVNAVVRTLAVSSSTLYVGGDFGTVNGLSRIHLAALAPATGATLTTWHASTSSGVVRSLLVTPDGSKLVVAGDLTYLDNTVVKGIGAVSATNGTLAAWNTNQTVYSYGGKAGFYSLSTDGSSIFGTGWNFGGTGNLEGMFKASGTDGTVTWVEDCHGDTYASAPFNGSVYTVGHPHTCANDGGWPETNPRTTMHTMAFTGNATGTLHTNTEAGYADLGGLAAPSIMDWFPLMQTGTVTGQNQAAWTIVGNGQYLVLAGEFPIVNGVAQQGMVRFAVKPIAKPKRGPRAGSAGFTPTARAGFGSVQVSIPAEWDQDNLTLHYALLRNGAQVATADVASTFWSLPTVSLTDSTAARHTTYSYSVTVKDDDGHTVTSVPVNVTTP